MTVAEAKLESMGLSLPSAPQPVANYVRCRRTGNLVFVSGTGPSNWPDGTPCVGKLGRDLTVEKGYEAARSVALNMLASLKEFLGDLDKVKGVIKVLGMVNAAPDFTDHPKVINGCSDLLVAVLGDSARHSRSAVGMGSLPNGIPSMSAATGLIYDVGQRNGVWTMEALRWDTGVSDFHCEIGSDLKYNSAFAGTEVGLGGGLYTGILAGILRVHP